MLDRPEADLLVYRPDPKRKHPVSTAKPAMSRLHIYLPVKTIKEVRAEAKKLGLPVSELIRRAVQDHLQK